MDSLVYGYTLSLPDTGDVFVETLDGISDSQPLYGRTYREIFTEYKDAQAIWILRPGAREPYRVGWKYGLYGIFDDGTTTDKFGKSGKSNRRARTQESPSDPLKIPSSVPHRPKNRKGDKS